MASPQNQTRQSFLTSADEAPPTPELPTSGNLRACRPTPRSMPLSADADLTLALRPAIFRRVSPAILHPCHILFSLLSQHINELLFSRFRGRFKSLPVTFMPYKAKPSSTHVRIIKKQREGVLNLQKFSLPACLSDIEPVGQCADSSRL